MPNRQPPCPFCGPKKRHLPSSCPELRKRGQDEAQGIHGIPNDIPALVAALKVAREAIDAALRNIEGA